jgi:oxygen-independent coproporphyrinogen-3 oxidase
VRAPRGYLAYAGTARGVGGDDAIAAAELPFEFMLNALRLNDGFELDTFGARTGVTPDQIAKPLASLQQRGWLAREQQRVYATELGRRWLNDVIAAFLPATPRPRRTPAGAPHA